MFEISVTNFLFAREAFEGECRDYRLIGVFNCQIGPVLMERCRLRFGVSGRPIASPPAARDRAGKIHLTDSDVRNRLLQLAIEALHARGGEVPPCPSERLGWDRPGQIR